ncbi:hypothetical protein LSTR_LSTR011733 [Laodelphax striatellus]|uniref:Major facilitator superfamily (MFS) profile domain-containing protein n=1 Tax=Laodelphax striatellus TaxID=195883 RepID=A0A482WMS8_LAOST|nr:hypothetical protein LSTR_LSTR011733 [Laodelphax striatellus]
MAVKSKLEMEPTVVVSSLSSSTLPLNKQEQGPVGCRQVQAIMLFLLFLVAYGLRYNLSVAIVAMAPSGNSGNSSSSAQTFDWDVQKKGAVLSAFFWGYFLVQVPAGLLGQYVSPKLLLTLTTTACSLLTLITPFGVQYGGWEVLFIIRVLEGLCQGFYVPLTYILASKWCPLTEQNRFIGFTLNGGTFGVTLAMPLSGFLASSTQGWPLIFYTTGVVGLLWVVLWVFQGADSPATHKRISQAEKDYIQTSLQHNSTKTIRTPWLEIFTSKPVWAFIAAHIGCGWLFAIIFTQMPSYISSVLGFDIKTNGLLSALPYLTMWCLSFPVCWLADIMSKHRVWTTTTQRKVWATISQTGAALVLVCLGFVERDAVAAMIVLVITVSLSSCAFSGVYVNPLDLAPNFAGVLIGIGNGLENISSILAPLSVGWILTDQKSVFQWTMVFLLALVVAGVNNLIFLIWSSAKLQPWNEPTNNVKRAPISINT